MHQPLVIDTACRFGMSCLLVNACNIPFPDKHSSGTTQVASLVMRETLMSMPSLTRHKLNLNSLLLYGVVT